MIERYQRSKMAGLWSTEAQFRAWLDIEILACEGWAKVGKIPQSSVDDIRAKADFRIEDILKREEETKHDVAAFVSVVQDNVGENGRWIHWGLTSSDVVDTAFAYRMKTSAEMILEELDKLLAVTRERAIKEKKVPMIGRTHGIHAEPTTMGTKWLLWYDALRRSRARIASAKEEVSVGKISGAVGNYAHMPPEVEKHVCEKLGLKPDSVSTQVICRDRFASYFNALGLLGSTIEMIATEIRHLQRTEVGEAREGFSKGQKGSSAMPHKRNPIASENLCGLARMLRSMTIPAMENCALWHERDISHSSVERIIGPDANILADYMIGRLEGVLRNLETFPERMMQNLEMLQGVTFSQRVLLALTDSGMSRDDAYSIVQSHALASLDKKESFLKRLKADSRVTDKIAPKALEAVFDLPSSLQHVDYVFEKVLGR